MESHPEEDYDSEYQHQTDDALAGLGRRHLLYRCIRRGFFLLFYTQNLTESALAKVVNTDAGNDRYTGYGKREVI